MILYLNVCTVDNCGTAYRRPEYLAARDFSAIRPAAEDCLTAMAT